MKTKYGINYEDRVFIYGRKISRILRFCIACAMSLLSIWYTLILIFARFKIKKEKKKYYFSICAIFKDEGLILKEWIEYNLIIGVDHFYLYNNNSTDNFNDILRPYIDKGLVTLIDWNFPPPAQFPAYEHFYNKFWKESQWVAFIDLDEFICPFRAQTVKEWIKKYENYGSVVVYWKQFGTSGKIHNDNSKLITEQYTICWDKFYDTGKTFVNTNYLVMDFSARNLHSMATSIKIFGITFVIPPINEFKKFVKYESNKIGWRNSIRNFTIQINHYGTLSYSNYINNKIKRGDVNNHIRDLETFFWAEQYNVASDNKIFRFQTELKINMGLADDTSAIIHDKK